MEGDYGQHGIKRERDPADGANLSDPNPFASVVVPGGLRPHAHLYGVGGESKST